MTDQSLTRLTREKNLWTQKQLAESIGATARWIKYVESGKYELNRKDREKIQNLLEKNLTGGENRIVCL